MINDRVGYIEWCVVAVVATFVFCLDYIYFKFFYDFSQEEKDIE